MGISGAERPPSLSNRAPFLPWARVVCHFVDGRGEPFGFVACLLVLLHALMGRGPRPQVFWMACAPLDSFIQGVATNMAGVAGGCVSQVFSFEAFGVTELGTPLCFV